MLLSVAAQAAPRVALVTGETTPAEATLARVTLEAAGLDVLVVDEKMAPLSSEDAALRTVRHDLQRAVATARASFLATRYAEARTQVAAAQKDASDWAGQPDVARNLAELDLLAAQCGDALGFAAAAAHDDALELDPAAYSPDVRRNYARAVANRARLHRATLHVSAGSPATLFVDGVAHGALPADVVLPLGPHALYAVGTTSCHRTVKLDRDTQVALPLVAAPVSASTLRGHALGTAPVDATELTSVAQVLATDAALVVQVDGNRVITTVAGPSIPLASADQHGDRATLIGQSVKKLAAAVLAPCSLAHTPPEHARAGGPLALSLSAGACVDAVRVTFRVPPRSWQTRGGTLDSRHALRLEVPLPSSDRASDLEYYVAGQDAHGHDVSALRDMTSPLRVPLEPNLVRRHWYGKWWIWTIAGVVVAGAVTAAVVVTTRPGPELIFARPMATK